MRALKTHIACDDGRDNLAMLLVDDCGDAHRITVGLLVENEVRRSLVGVDEIDRWQPGANSITRWKFLNCWDRIGLVLVVGTISLIPGDGALNDEPERGDAAGLSAEIEELRVVVGGAVGDITKSIDVGRNVLGNVLVSF